MRSVLAPRSGASQSRTLRRAAALPTVLAGLGLLAGCAGGGAGNLGLSGMTGGIPGITNIAQTTEHGFIMPANALEQVPVGSSRDQALIALGTPSTTASFEGEVFYYISQTRRRPVQFMDARVVDQKVLALYFDNSRQPKVTRVAQYGLQDGKVFDFITRTTPTGGADLNFMQQLLTPGNSAPTLPGAFRS